jgi:hypothetical protein
MNSHPSCAHLKQRIAPYHRITPTTPLKKPCCASQHFGKPALPRRSIAVRFRPNKQTPTARAQCDAMCHCGLMHRSSAPYSITSSASASSLSGTVSPSALAS